jgi:hypothetical protein
MRLLSKLKNENAQFTLPKIKALPELEIKPSNIRSLNSNARRSFSLLKELRNSSMSPQ